MNITQRGLLTLLRSAVTGEKLCLPEGFQLEEADGLIRSQSLLPLAYQGAYNCGISPKTELMQQYQKQYYRTLIRSEKQMRTVQQIYAAFEENGIDYMPLKGCVMKSLYPQPEMRVMSDADILIRLDQYERIIPIMQALGFTGGAEGNHDFSWKKEELHTELHKLLLVPRGRTFYDYHADGWDLAIHQEGHRYGMGPEDNFIYLFTHMTKHYQYSGIGCRQFVDLFVFSRSHPQMDRSYIENVMEHNGLLEFYRNVCRLLECWFADGSEDEKVELMTQYILSGGNWGSYETFLRAKQLKTRGESQRGTKTKALGMVLFLPLEEMCFRYPVLKRIPWLLPVFWVYRWLCLLVKKPRTVLNKLKLLSRLSDKKVDSQYEAFRFVGLKQREE